MNEYIVRDKGIAYHIDMNKVINAIQRMVNTGEVSMFNDHFLYNAKDCAYDLGTDDDLCAVYTRLMAYKGIRV